MFRPTLELTEMYDRLWLINWVLGESAGDFVSTTSNSTVDNGLSVAACLFAGVFGRLRVVWDGTYPRYKIEFLLRAVRQIIPMVGPAGVPATPKLPNAELFPDEKVDIVDAQWRELAVGAL